MGLLVKISHRYHGMTAYSDPPSTSYGPNSSSGERSKPLVNVLLFGSPPLLPVRQLLGEPGWNRMPHPVQSGNPVLDSVPVPTPFLVHPVLPPPVLLLPQCNLLLAEETHAAPLCLS